MGDLFLRALAAGQDLVGADGHLFGLSAEIQYFFAVGLYLVLFLVDDVVVVVHLLFELGDHSVDIGVLFLVLLLPAAGFHELGLVLLGLLLGELLLC